MSDLTILLPYRTVPDLTALHRTAPCRIVPCHTVSYRSFPYRTVPYITVPCRILSYSTISYSTYRTIPHRTMTYLTAPCHTLPHRQHSRTCLQLNLDVVGGNRHHRLAQPRERSSQEDPQQILAPLNFRRLFSSAATAAAAVAAAVESVPPRSVCVIDEPIGGQRLPRARDGGW